MSSRFLLAVALAFTLSFSAWDVATCSAPATEEQLQVLHEILGRAEFRVVQTRGPLDLLLDPMRAAFGAAFREISRWLGSMPRVGADGPVSLGALLALAIVLAAGLVTARALSTTLASEATLADQTMAGPPPAEAELRRADQLASEGDLRGALHYRYLAVLRRLDERGALQYDRSLTNQEHLQLAGSSPMLADALAPLVAAFDLLWYGQPSCSADEYDRFAALADRVWQAAG